MQAMDTNMIGRMPTSFNNAPRDTSRLSGLFLNTNDRSPDSGNVTAWDFCYYISVTQPSMITIQAGVWRESSGYYTLVNNSLIDLPIPEPQPGFQFVCRHWPLSECQDEPTFEVQEGDIVGMHVNDTSDNNMVHILGMPPDNETTAGTKKIRSMNITDINNVSNSTLESVGYSLYLVAVLGIVYTVVYAILVATVTSLPMFCCPGNGSEMIICPDSTPETTSAAPYLPKWAIALICVLGATVLVLTIMIMAVFYRLCHLSR